MDPLTVFFARVFGIYFLIAAAMVFANRKALMTGVEAMFRERFAQLLAAMMSFLGGILYVNIYHDWTSLAGIILSLIGWAIIVKGLLYAFAPEAHLAKMTKVFTEKAWYTMDGILALVLGAYLTAYGYALF